MTEVGGTKWRILVVEDKEDIANQLIQAIPGFVTHPDTAKGYPCQSFEEAISRLEDERYDLLILDLKDDSADEIEEDETPAGLKVFEALKRTRFTPVIFYTALAHKVRAEQTSFVRVVEKTESIAKVKEEVMGVLATQLPALSRRVEEIQRDYLWDFVSNHWKEFELPHEQADIAYLLARRLALSLQAEARTLAGKVSAETVPHAQSTDIHPMEMYVHPPVSQKRRLAGDIVSGKIGDEVGNWLVLTPSCDFEQKGRLDNVLLAQCMPLAKEPEYKKWADGAENADQPLKSLIGDKRQKAQSERFKFLPGTFFLPDSVVDFQRLKTITPEELGNLEAVASLDNPFAEAVLTRFSRYFGRLGTPDIDKEVVLKRLQATRKENA